MELHKKFPFLIRISLVLFCVLACGYILYIGQDIIIPIAFAVVLALLLLPMNKMMEKKLKNRVAAILLSLFISLIFIATIIYFFSTQVAGFVDDIPKIRNQLHLHLLTVQDWISDQFHLSKTEQTQYFNVATSEITVDKGGFIGRTFMTITESIIFLVLLPIYTFLILYYRDMIRRFLVNIFAEQHREKVMDVIKESKVILHGYMVGLLIEMSVITMINFVGFLIVGIKYAFFLALFSAILNIIPYIGMLIANVICMVITLTTSNNLMDVIWVAVVLAVVQFLDNNIIMPKIVSTKVKINALMTILGVLIGGAIAGVSGMFLSIPTIAIAKVIFDRVDGLQPWGEFLGDDITETRKGKLIKHFAKVRAAKKKADKAAVRSSQFGVRSSEPGAGSA